MLEKNTPDENNPKLPQTKSEWFWFFLKASCTQVPIILLIYSIFNIGQKNGGLLIILVIAIICIVCTTLGFTLNTKRIIYGDWVRFHFLSSLYSVLFSLAPTILGLWYIFQPSFCRGESCMIIPFFIMGLLFLNVTTLVISVSLGLFLHFWFKSTNSRKYTTFIYLSLLAILFFLNLFLQSYYHSCPVFNNKNCIDIYTEKSNTIKRKINYDKSLGDTLQTVIKNDFSECLDDKADGACIFNKLGMIINSRKSFNPLICELYSPNDVNGSRYFEQRLECYATVAILEQKEEYCKEIKKVDPENTTLLTYENYCLNTFYLNQAQTSKDISYCEKIPALQKYTVSKDYAFDYMESEISQSYSNLAKDKCINSLAVLNADPKICKNSTNENDCLAYYKFNRDRCPSSLEALQNICKSN